MVLGFWYSEIFSGNHRLRWNNLRGATGKERMKMPRWTSEEEEKLLDLYSSGHTYEEIAEELGRSVSSIDSKLTRLRQKREMNETNEPIYRGEGVACTAALPEAQQIYDELILALLDEFRKIRETLPDG